MFMSCLVLHIPHASTLIPGEYRSLFTLTGRALTEELLRMTDRYTDELFDLPVPRVIAPVSRLVCDMERFRNDEEESMSRIGMGVCYTRTSLLTPLKVFPASHREEILRRFYDPHHLRLEAAVREALALNGRCLLADCHSFSSRPLPYEPVQDPDRPDICIGTDRFHTPDRLTEFLLRSWRSLGLSVRLNDPYAGTLVPMRYLYRDRRVMSVMLEINRGLYMDEATGEKLPGFSRLREQIRGVLTEAERISKAL